MIHRDLIWVKIDTFSNKILLGPKFSEINVPIEVGLTGVGGVIVVVEAGAGVPGGEVGTPANLRLCSKNNLSKISFLDIVTA